MKILDWLEWKLRQRHENLGGEYYRPANFDGAWVARDVVDKGRDLVGGVIRLDSNVTEEEIVQFRKYFNCLEQPNMSDIIVVGNKHEINSGPHWCGVTGSSRFLKIDNYMDISPSKERPHQPFRFVVCSYCETRNRLDAWNCDACGAPILEEK